MPEEHGVEDYRFNDGKISPAGVFIGGRMHSTGDKLDGKHSHWYRLEWHKEQKNSRLVQVRKLSLAATLSRMAFCFLRCDTYVLLVFIAVTRNVLPPMLHMTAFRPFQLTQTPLCSLAYRFRLCCCVSLYSRFWYDMMTLVQVCPVGHAASWARWSAITKWSGLE